MDNYSVLCSDFSSFIRFELDLPISSSQIDYHCEKLHVLATYPLAGRSLTQKIHFLVWDNMILTILHSLELRDIFQHFFPGCNILYETMGVVATATITADSPQNTSRLTAMIYYLLIIFKRFKPEMVVSHRKDDDDDDSTPGGSGDGDLGTGPTTQLAACSSIMEDEIWNTRASSITIETSCQVDSSSTTRASKDCEEEEVDRGALPLPSDTSECDNDESNSEASIDLEDPMPTDASGEQVVQSGRSGKLERPPHHHMTIRPMKAEPFRPETLSKVTRPLADDCVHKEKSDEEAESSNGNGGVVRTPLDEDKNKEFLVVQERSLDCFPETCSSSIEASKLDRALTSDGYIDSLCMWKDLIDAANVKELAADEKSLEDDIQSSPFADGIQTSLDLSQHDHNIKGRSLAERAQAASDERITADLISLVLSEKIEDEEDEESETFSTIEASCGTIVINSGLSKVHSAESDIATHFMTCVMYRKASALKGIGVEGFRHLDQSSVTARPNASLHQQFNDLVDQSSVTSIGGIQSAIVFRGKEILPCRC